MGAFWVIVAGITGNAAMRGAFARDHDDRCRCRFGPGGKKRSGPCLLGQGPTGRLGMGLETHL